MGDLCRSCGKDLLIMFVNATFLLLSTQDACKVGTDFSCESCYVVICCLFLNIVGQGQCCCIRFVKQDYMENARHTSILICFIFVLLHERLCNPLLELV